MPNIVLTLAATLTAVQVAVAQPAADNAGAANSAPADGRGDVTENMVVNINNMNPEISARIRSVADRYHQQKEGLTRSFMSETLRDAKFSLGSSLIDVMVNEVFSIAKYKKQQRTNWETMIRNECNYTDSTQSVVGNTDFYSENSFYGPLDPSDINFDGISLNNERDGQPFLYVECHIDTTRIDHLFRHSKFYLVLDSVYFNPYLCHLPNLRANNISVDKTADEQFTRNDTFSFDERGNLCVSMDITITSSWINEAVMIMQDVELGKFSFSVSIPRTDEGQPYTYSRAQQIALGQTPIDIDGESFIVPRSYMPLAGEVRMWGTGEYKIKVRFRESCDFLTNRNTTDTAGKQTKFDWNDDYKQLRKMQKQSSGTTEILRTIYKQDGNTLAKSVVKSLITSTAEEASMIESTSNAMMP